MALKIDNIANYYSKLKLLYMLSMVKKIRLWYGDTIGQNEGINDSCHYHKMIMENDLTDSQLYADNPLISSSTRYRHGTRTRMMMVAKTIPKPSDMAIGITYWACSDLSKMIGDRPPKVVKVVSTIGRKRR